MQLRFVSQLLLLLNFTCVTACRQAGSFIASVCNPGPDLLSIDLNLQVSDTTGDDSSHEAGYLKKVFFAGKIN
jgi:hypothetical protein